jgi:putative endonuclease
VPKPRQWVVYLLWSESGQRTYVGVTVDAERRLAQHNGERSGGAKATRARRPWTLVRTWGPFATNSEAQSVEYKIKRLSGLSARRAYKAQDAGGPHPLRLTS